MRAPFAFLAGSLTAPVVAADMYWAKRTVSAAFSPQDGAGSVYLASTGKYWRIGGWDSVVPTTNEVWSSPDLITWTLELAYDAAPAQTGVGARFRPRHLGCCFLHTYNGTQYIYLVGGDHLDAFFAAAPSNGYASDVWRSSDGVTWERTCTSDSVGWAGRFLTVSGSYDDAIWVVGGQDIQAGASPFHNDVWKSTDGGATFTQVVADAAPSATRWASRGFMQKLVSFNDRLWLIGGGTYETPTYPVPRTFYAETWSTTDGVTWTQHTAPPWTARESHCVEVYGGRIFVGFGYDGSGIWSGNRNDVWSTDDGETWFDHGSAPAQMSHADAFAAGPDGLAFIMGNNGLSTGIQSCFIMQENPAPSGTPSLAGIEMWFESERLIEDSGFVIQWPDISGNSRHLNNIETGGAWTFAPRYIASDAIFNGAASLGTSAAADEAFHLVTTGRGSAFSIGYPQTVYHVVSPLSGGAVQFVWWRLHTSHATTGAPSFYGAEVNGTITANNGLALGDITAVTDVSSVTCIVYDTAGASAGYRDDPVTAQFSGTTADATAFDALKTGTLSGSSSRWRQTALLVFSGIHDAATRADWMAYLAAKYQ